VHREEDSSEHDSWGPENIHRDALGPPVKYADYLKSVGKELKPPVVNRGAGEADGGEIDS
jgi:hypothetical protein